MKSIALLLLPALIWAPMQSLVLAAPPQAKAASVKTVADPGWPREIVRDGVKLTVYQPQIDEWKDYRELKARIAFVMTTKDGKPVIGVADLEGSTTADAVERTVFIRDLKIASARFPSLPEAEVGPMEALLKKTFPGRSLTVSLDRLAAGVDRGKATKPLALKMDPPKIFVSAQPAILLVVEGKLVKAPIAGTKLEFVVNTNWDLLYEAASESYFLLSDNVWLTATKLDGEWSIAASLPKDFGKLPKGDQWDHVTKAVPPKVERGMRVPHVYYSEEPAELIAFNGNPTWQEVEDTSLLWGKNTESWVFEDTKDRQIYFLVSGRWFRAAKWEGPWTYAGGDLPEDFKRIPDDSECADVLASVPGTPEAEDAVLLAEVPQEAVINRKQAEAKAKVVYDGDPKFEPIEGTQMTYAANTSSDVISVNNNYYLCQDAVWFVSSAAVGPWVICVDVPRVIYSIPPAYPVHRVVYVKTDHGDSDDVVVCSYTAGYYGAFVAGVGVGAALVWERVGIIRPTWLGAARCPFTALGPRLTAWPLPTIPGRVAMPWAAGSMDPMLRRDGRLGTIRRPATMDARRVSRDPTVPAQLPPATIPGRTRLGRPARGTTATRNGARAPSGGATTGCEPGMWRRTMEARPAGAVRMAVAGCGRRTTTAEELRATTATSTPDGMAMCIAATTMETGRSGTTVTGTPSITRISGKKRRTGSISNGRTRTDLAPGEAVNGKSIPINIGVPAKVAAGKRNTNRARSNDRGRMGAESSDSTATPLRIERRRGAPSPSPPRTWRSA